MTLSISQGMAIPTAVTDLVTAHRERTPDASPRLRFPTGLDPLDAVLNGGCRARDLALLTGRPGVGKSILALQWARNVACNDLDAIFISYEYGPEALLERLIGLEMASAGRMHDELNIVDTFERHVPEGARDATTVQEQTRRVDALDRIEQYAPHLTFVHASRRYTDVDTIDRLVMEHRGIPTALFIDPLQKVAVRPAIDDEAHRSSYLAESFKDIAVTREVAVVVVSAVDKDALRDSRVRMHHVRGSSALIYEPDVVLVLNERTAFGRDEAVAYDSSGAFRNRLVISVEKHRDGLSDFDIEFAKDFSHYRIHPDGMVLPATSINDVVLVD
ncbi:MAG TPA: DnaB-like helicase C-terminal domain-containing protein [Acidimicrobiia bacterium]|jgi:replicative DNA helicase|nr:DnaB-like helicase C-terminal domain-containing protein [Acidimicrobiia bacterium]